MAELSHSFTQPRKTSDVPTPNGPTRLGLVNSMLKEVFQGAFTIHVVNMFSSFADLDGNTLRLG